MPAAGLIAKPPRLEYVPFSGLDEESPLTMPRRGALIGCANYERVFGAPGLRRIRGYERFDGRAAPSEATYYAVAFDAGGTTAIAVGNTITTASGSARVLRVALTSGSWVGGNAAGSLIVTAMTGTILDNEAISVGGSPRATAAANAVQGAYDDDAYASDIVLARDYYRDLIVHPAGSGPIRGLKFWRGVLYCLRDDANGYSATLWKSSASGWSAVKTGLRAGGTLRAIVANFSGDARAQKLYGVDGKNKLWSYDGTTFTFGPYIYQTEAWAGSATGTYGVTPLVPSGGVISVGLGAVPHARAWASSDVVIVYGRDNPANWMIGSFVGGASLPAGLSGVANLTVTSFNNAGGEPQYDLCMLNGDDRAHAMAAHKDYLFLAFGRGQLQTTDIGDPMTYTLGGGGTAQAFPVGDEITDLVSLRDDVLGIFRDNGISMLYGADEATFQLKKFTRASNCRAGSAVEIGGNAVFVSDAGVQALHGTQAFGDFESSNLARSARRTEQLINADFRCAAVIRSDSQYRIYGADKQVLVMTWQSQSPSARTVEFTRLLYEHQPVCVDAETYEDEEFVFFGTDDGKVMRERKGTSFDGADIEAFVRTSYWHNGSPQVRKRWRKLVIDIASGLTPVEIMYRQDLDFQGPDQGEGYAYTAQSSGGAFDGAYFDEFFFDNPEAAQIHANVDGVGSSMSLVIWSLGDSEPHTLMGMHQTYTALKVQK